MNPLRIYLAGPMTGKPEHNFPAFHAAAKDLREQGAIVTNPAENHLGIPLPPRPVYMREDIKALLECQAIAFLEGFEFSEGAGLEFNIAAECGLKSFVVLKDWRGVHVLSERTKGELCAQICNARVKDAIEKRVKAANPFLNCASLKDMKPVELDFKVKPGEFDLLFGHFGEPPLKGGGLSGEQAKPSVN